MSIKHSKNVMAVANYAPDVGYAWWLMEHFWLMIARECTENNVVCYLAYPRPGKIPDKIKASKLKIVYCDWNSRTPFGLFRIIQTVIRYDIGTIYFTDRRWFHPLYLALHLVGVRTIINHDHTPGDRPTIGGIKGWIKARRNQLRGLTCSHWIAISPLMKQRAIKNERIPAESCFVVQNGIIPVKCPSTNSGSLDQLFPVSRGSLRIVSVGRANTYKRVDFIIDVAEKVTEILGANKVDFVYFGDGPALDELIDRANTADIVGKTFHFAGNRADLRELLCEFDCALHAARGEGFSLAILEFMSAGLVTIVPDIPSVCQAIDHCETGLIYNSAEVDSAVDMIVRMAKDPSTRTRISEAARAKVDSAYNLSRMDRKFSCLIQQFFQWDPSTRH